MQASATFAKVLLSYKIAKRKEDGNQLLQSESNRSQVLPNQDTGAVLEITKNDVTVYAEIPTVKTFEGGKNLIAVSQTNGIGDRNAACSVTILDPNLELSAILRTKALVAGGIVIPEGLLEASEKVSETASANTTFTVPKEGTTGDELAKAVVLYCRSVGVTDVYHQAAILGNIERETNMGQYTEEISRGVGSEYGTTYYGRGLIQITWKDNYERFGKYFKQDFVGNPGLVKELKWAIPIAVLGMTGTKGSPTFTGVKLSDFGSGASFDFVNSRKTVNGLDHAQEVADNSKRWLKRIPQLLTSKDAAKALEKKQKEPKKDTQTFAGVIEPEKPNLNQIPAPGNANLTGATEGNTQKKADEVIQASLEIPDDAAEITIERYDNQTETIVASNFWYVSHSISSTLPHTLTITGKGLRATITTSKTRKTHHNISLRQIAERLGTIQGTEIVIPESIASEEIASKLKQNAETDYDFLLRIAESAGYTMATQTKPPKIVLNKIKDAPKVSVKREWNCTLKTAEEASSERILKLLPPIASVIDGEAIGQGFKTELEMINAPMEVLSMKLGSILKIPEKVIPGIPNDSAFCREYQLTAISDSWAGVSKTVLELVIPVNVKKKVTASDSKQITDDATMGSNSNVKGVPNIQVNWSDPNSKVSKYFKVVDVTKGESQRAVTPGSDVEKKAKILASRLDEIAEAWAKKVGTSPEGLISVTSWYRPFAVNLAARGAPNSQHIYGGASDIYVNTGNPSEFEAWLDSGLWKNNALGYGIASGKGFSHLDLREGKIRWQY